MNVAFNAQSGPIVVPAEILGTLGSVVLRLALDTGATRTLISTSALVRAGYDPALSPTRIQIATASGIESVPEVVVTSIQSLGLRRSNFSLLAHTLPPTIKLDGLLGLDFLRGQLLTVDFRNATITLA